MLQIVFKPQNGDCHGPQEKGKNQNPRESRQEEGQRMPYVRLLALQMQGQGQRQEGNGPRLQIDQLQVILLTTVAFFIRHL